MIKILKLFLLVCLSGLGEGCVGTNKPTFPTIPNPPSGGECKCGRANHGRARVETLPIVGGTVTRKNEYPWQVAFVRGKGYYPHCGGSIVSSKTIVTAAHCLDGASIDDFLIVVGEHDISVNDGEKYVKACSIKMHNKYNKKNFDYDYAIITLCHQLEFSTSVSPVCLPDNQGQGSEYEDRSATVSGWGTMWSGGDQPLKLNSVNLKTMKNKKCYGLGGYPSYAITDRMICAADPGKDSCQSDSGGPLVIQNNKGSYELAGIVSYGKGCAWEKFPGVYARVTNQLGWIKDRITGKTCAK